jgi:hypothetical protein
MKDQNDQQPEVEAVAAVEGDELQQLLRFECISMGSIDNAKKTLTLTNRCDRCMAATIFWTKFQGGSFTRTYDVPARSAIKIRLEGESSSLTEENPC